MRFTLFAACLALGATQLCAQAISTIGIERSPQRDAWWRIVYDNDFFTATDKYFTQGMELEFVTRRTAASRATELPMRTTATLRAI
jgi:hypothetical protein